MPFPRLDASSAVHARSPSRSLPDAVIRAFSSSLTTTVFSQRSMRRFDTSPRRAAPKGQTFISCTAPRSITQLPSNLPRSWHTPVAQRRGVDVQQRADRAAGGQLGFAEITNPVLVHPHGSGAGLLVVLAGCSHGLSLLARSEPPTDPGRFIAGPAAEIRHPGRSGSHRYHRDADNDLICMNECPRGDSLHT